MQPHKVNVLLDQAFGSSGKGKFAAMLADDFYIRHLSSSNFPNAGHTVMIGDVKHVAKALPTAAILNISAELQGLTCFVSPGSGFRWEQLLKEWLACQCPNVIIHGMASIITDAHVQREHEGDGATTHIGSTRQGTSAAVIDKILRKFDCLLANNSEGTFSQAINSMMAGLREKGRPARPFDEMARDRIKVVSGQMFRDLLHQRLDTDAILHEGSQGYALSLDHGPAPHYGTSRNCTTAKALDDLGLNPHLLGDVYLNVRTYPIRVAHIFEGDKQVGNSGPFYSDSAEITWEEVARAAGMPDEEYERLLAREHTTVTKRLRRVSTFSWKGLVDAARTNGATKLILNFAQYLNWSDHQVRGKGFARLSRVTQNFIDRMQVETGVPVAYVGTGADHADVVSAS